MNESRNIPVPATKYIPPRSYTYCIYMKSSFKLFKTLPKKNLFATTNVIRFRWGGNKCTSRGDEMRCTKIHFKIEEHKSLYIYMRIRPFHWRIFPFKLINIIYGAGIVYCMCCLLKFHQPERKNVKQFHIVSCRKVSSGRTGVVILSVGNY
jgi:hypothetical protein